MKFNFDHLSNNFKGIILAMMGFAAFSLADANAKYLTLDYQPEHIVGIVAIFTTFICVLLSPFMGGMKKTLRTKKIKFHVARGLLNSIASLMIVYSFSKLTLAAAYSMIFMVPFVVALLAIPLLKEKIPPRGWIAIAGGFIGVLIVVRPGMADLDPYMLVPLASTFFIALLFLMARPLGEGETLASFAFYPAASNLILITPFILYFYGLPAPDDILIFFIQAVLVVAGLVLTTCAFRIGSPAIISPFMYIDILWALGFDYFLFKEAPAVWTILGASVIIASGIYLIDAERKHMKLQAARI